MKHNCKGCYSTLRFRRLRIEHNLKIFQLIEEKLGNFFIKESMVNISGLIIAGDSYIMNQYLSLMKHKIIPEKYILSLIDIEKEGELGFNEAIELSMLNN